MDKGVFGKYLLSKASGKPLDPKACYFVLRLDSDAAARKAVLAYAEHCGNAELADDLRAAVAELEAPCSCRYVDEHCARHPMFSRVWQSGESPNDEVRGAAPHGKETKR